MGGRIGKAQSRPCVLACFDTAYRLIIRLHDEAGHLVAHCLLPYEFTVTVNGNCVRNGKQRAHTPARQRALRPGSNLPAVTALEPISPEPPASTQRSQQDSSHMDPVLRRLSPADRPASRGRFLSLSPLHFPPSRLPIVDFSIRNLALPPPCCLLLLQPRTHSLRAPAA